MASLGMPYIDYEDYQIGLLVDRAKKEGFFYWALSRGETGLYNASFGNEAGTWSATRRSRRDAVAEAQTLAFLANNVD